MYALAMGLLSAKTLFRYTKIKVFIDAKSIRFFRLCKSTSEQIARLSVFLSGFESDLFHISSSQNFLSDYLSRVPGPEEDGEGEDSL